jgi:predicted nucleotidyltransferase
MKNVYLSPAMRVPSINVRERIPQEAIDDVVEQIATQFDPKQIILFGSYAYGMPRPESDVDLLVVMETPFKEWEQRWKIRQGINYNFGLDLVVRTPATLAQRLEWGDFFLREVIEKGKVVYESANS